MIYQICVYKSCIFNIYMHKEYLVLNNKQRLTCYKIWPPKPLLETLPHVTLCRWSAKQTTPLSVLARNQTKGLDSRSRRERKLVRERERSGTKERRRRVTRVANRHRTAEVTSQHERGSRWVREDRSRWVSIPHGL